jgi:hypothetical protein
VFGRLKDNEYHGTDASTAFQWQLYPSTSFKTAIKTNKTPMKRKIIFSG